MTRSTDTTPDKTRPEGRPEHAPRREEERPDQIAILPGAVPGHSTDPADPRFPGSQPDLA